jgi:uncharacterized lipoprotein YajG
MKNSILTVLSLLSLLSLLVLAGCQKEEVVPPDPEVAKPVIVNGQQAPSEGAHYMKQMQNKPAGQ